MYLQNKNITSLLSHSQLLDVHNEYKDLRISKGENFK